MPSDTESISSGISLPGWMRNKVEKNDFDGISFSPPPHEESFFYIRYPVKQQQTTSETNTDSSNNGLKQITDIFNSNRKLQDSQKFRHVDFSKHTEPCKQFLKDSPNTPAEGIKNPPKSFGTDDGFKGPGAACGSSIVKVAQQMVSSRTLTGSRGFKIASLDDTSSNSDPDSSFQTKTVEDQQVQASKLIQPVQSQLHVDDISTEKQQQQHYKNVQQHYQLPQNISESSRLMYRRGSKSLPSSPLGSPKSMRKYNPNPYFTTTSIFSSSSNSGSTEGRGWFLSSLLGIQRQATSTSSITNIEEESSERFSAAQNYNNNNNNNYTSDSKSTDSKKILKAKPSELREMNFWSPTSM